MGKTGRSVPSYQQELLAIFTAWNIWSKQKWFEFLRSSARLRQFLCL